MPLLFIRKDNKKGFPGYLKKIFDLFGIKSISLGEIGYDEDGEFKIKNCTIIDKENFMDVNEWVKKGE